MRLVWDIDPVIIELGPALAVRYYGVFFALVFIGGFLLFRWQVLRGGGTEDDAYNFLMPGVLGVVVGARLGHVLFYNLERALSDPWWVFKIWEGGLSSHGATIGLIAALAYYSWRYRKPFWECADRFSFSAALGATLIRLGNFFNSEIVGRVTGGDYGIKFPRFDYGLPLSLVPYRHPSQFYEAALGILVLTVLLLVDRRYGEKRPRGLPAALFLICYFSARFLVEFFKERHIIPDSFPLSMGQLLSIPGILLGAWILKRALTRPQPAGWPPYPALKQPENRKAAAKGGSRRPGKSHRRR